MIQEEALIKSVYDNMAEVEIIRSKPCGLCGQTQGCGNSIWGKIFSPKKGSLMIKNSINAKEGDHVFLAIEENYLLKASLLLYGIPLLSLFLGMLLSQAYLSSNNDFYSLVGGLIGFTLGVILVKYITVKNHDRLYQDAILVDGSHH